MGQRRARMIWAALHAVVLVVVLVVNGLAAGLPLNGMDTGALSDLYPNLFVPAGLTFSIWGLIYLSLLGLVVYGFTTIQAPEGRGHLEAIGPWFVVNCLANAGWIFAWHWLLHGLSLLLMLVILASLVVMYLRLGTGVRPVGPAETWLVRVPVSIYLGWITVATIANVTTLAVDLGAPRFGAVPAALTVVMLAIAVLLAGLMLWTRRDLPFALVVSWAFLGIYLKRSASVEDGSSLVALAAVVGLVALLGGVVGTAVLGLRRTTALDGGRR